MPRRAAAIRATATPRGRAGGRPAPPVIGPPAPAATPDAKRRRGGDSDDDALDDEDGLRARLDALETTNAALRRTVR
ncbi:MAG: hypothetical protein ACO3XL_06755, partial [Gemmobacter sp.]